MGGESYLVLVLLSVLAVGQAFELKDEHVELDIYLESFKDLRLDIRPKDISNYPELRHISLCDSDMVKCTEVMERGSLKDDSPYETKITLGRSVVLRDSYSGQDMMLNIDFRLTDPAGYVRKDIKPLNFQVQIPKDMQPINQIASPESALDLVVDTVDEVEEEVYSFRWYHTTLAAGVACAIAAVAINAIIKWRRSRHQKRRQPRKDGYQQVVLVDDSYKQRREEDTNLAVELGYLNVVSYV